MGWGGDYMSQTPMAVFTVYLCLPVGAHTHKLKSASGVFSHSSSHCHRVLTEPSVHQTVRLVGAPGMSVCPVIPHLCCSHYHLGLHNHVAIKVLGIQTWGLMLEQQALQ